MWSAQERGGLYLQREEGRAVFLQTPLSKVHTCGYFLWDIVRPSTPSIHKLHDPSVSCR